MENKNWSQIGDEIKDMVESAVESMDFKALNESLTRTVDEALSNVNRTLQNNMKSSKFRPGYEVRAKKNNPLKERFRNIGGLSGTGIVFSVLGYTFSVLLGIGIFTTLTATGFTGFLRSGILASVIMAPFFLVSVFLAYKGSSILGRIKRFRKYMEVLREREYCAVAELVDSVNKSSKFVLKDLKRMIRERYFLHGHLDHQGTCLMVTEQAYEQYKQAQQQLQERQKLEEMERQREKAFGKKEIPKEAKEVIVAGRQYLKAIRESDERIPGQKVSAKIERLENVVEKIFNRVEQHPELVEDLGKFMDYYLPTTVKLLKAYEELDAQEVQGENITGSKREIEQTLDTIEQAFENLLDSFFEKAAWDISSDISVLHNMFAQEGLTGNDFEKMRR